MECTKKDTTLYLWDFAENVQPEFHNDEIADKSLLKDIM
jgi:hypothetical protein